MKWKLHEFWNIMNLREDDIVRVMRFLILNHASTDNLLERTLNSFKWGKIQGFVLVVFGTLAGVFVALLFT